MLRWIHLLPGDLSRALNQRPYKLLVLLVAADLVFIFLHILDMNTHLIRGRLYLLDKDRSYAELYQYIKEFWIVALLLFLFVKKPSYLLASWCLIFTYILFDDAMRAHEQVGAFITDYYGFTASFGLPGRQYGQFVIASVVGAVIIVVLGASYILSNSRFRRTSNSLLFLLAGFFFFSFLIDCIHEFFMDTQIDCVVTVIEDGGEMLVISVIAWYVFYIDPAGDAI